VKGRAITQRDIGGINIPDAANFLSLETVKHVTSSVWPSKNLAVRYEGNRVGKG
jgi:hypothetical protein